MALIPYSVTVIAKVDSPYNVLPYVDVLIRDVIDLTLVPIYEDSDGLVPISQPGGKTDSNGIFKFYSSTSKLIRAEYVNDGVQILEPLNFGNSLIIEVDNESDEALAFANGAVAVVRTDLIAPRSSLFMDFKNPSAFMDKSEFFHPMTQVNAPAITDSIASPMGVGVADFSAGYLRTVDTTDLQLSDVTGWGMECYFRIKTSGVTNFIFSKGAAGELNDAWYLALLWNGSTFKIFFSAKNNTGVININYDHAADLTNFHHISLNNNGLNITIFVDGIPITSVANTTVFNGAGDLYVGGWNFTESNATSGYVDQIVISNDGPLREAVFTPPVA